MTQSEKVSQSLIGKKGNKARRWLGDNSSYSAKHMWLSKNFTKSGTCEKCGNSNNSRTEWANISGNHIRERTDYLELCPSCHRKMDLKKEYCPQGHKMDIDNTYYNTRGHRECKTCIKERREKRAKNNQV